jgi:hypothetical protein
MGSGVVGLRQEMVSVYTQLDPTSHTPANGDSSDSSSDASCVWRANCRAATWSTDIPASTTDPVDGSGGAVVKNLVLAAPCTA